MSLALEGRVTDVNGMAAHLMHAAADLDHVHEMEPRNRLYEEHAKKAEELREELLWDRLPDPWRNATAISDPDERFSAILSHRQFYGSRCQHLFEDAVDEYVNVFNSQPAAMY